MTISFFAQDAKVVGVVLNELNKPIVNAEVIYLEKGTVTNELGVFSIEIPSNTNVEIVFSSLGYASTTVTLNLKTNEYFEFNPVLKQDVQQMSEVVITSVNRNEVEGVVNLDPKTIRNTPSANAGVEGLLKTLPGVSNNNELSTQYNVRGGNFDENLVYVNEVEVYRPFLIRSGQQEGLSFVNTDLVDSVNFSAGGFQAKYGDKLSSVLDVSYLKPTSNSALAELSMLGGSLAYKGVSKQGKTSGVFGARYRNNSLLVDANQDSESNYYPRFADVQTYISRTINKKLEFSFLGNVALNLYNFEPISRTTNFGTFDSPKALSVLYDGNESDQYQTYFGAFKTTYKPSSKLNLRFIASAYQTIEEEYYDILAEYLVGDVNTVPGSENYGEIETIDGVGADFSHARNDLDALIINLEHKGTLALNNNQLDWGLKYTNENIIDRIDEYEFISDSGFLVDEVDTTPFNPFDPIYDGVISPFSRISAYNEVTTQRYSAYAQWSSKTLINNSNIWYNIGLRSQYWNVNANGNNEDSHILVSPRLQVAYKPNWDKDALFRLATGIYFQPPFYREMRDDLGAVVPSVEAQKAFHVSLSNDYSFKMWERPFKLTSEVYFKDLDNVNTYTVDNVKIRYRANNNAKAYAYGLDFRINGEFVPGTESWFSFGYLKTEENQDDRGWIARPNDQRLKFGVLFQDYVPSMPNLKMYLNLVYQTGLPGGSPSYEDPYLYQSRLSDYRRVDVGSFWVLIGENKKVSKIKFLNHFDSFELGLEVFNLFNNQNSITNTFVRDATTLNQYAVPNYLTPRVLNFKIKMGL